MKPTRKSASLAKLIVNDLFGLNAHRLSLRSWGGYEIMSMNKAATTDRVEQCLAKHLKDQKFVRK